MSTDTFSILSFQQLDTEFWPMLLWFSVGDVLKVFSISSHYMIPELSELLKRSVEKSLEDRIAISFSGGVDSTLIAAIAKKMAQTELFCAGLESCPDIEYAQKAAQLLGLPLEQITIKENEVLDIYGKCHSILPLDLLKVEILIPVWKVAEAAAKKNHSVLLFGAAAEELFVGYEKYYLFKEEGKDVEKILKEDFKNVKRNEIAWITKICRKHGIEARFPFYNQELADFMHAVPLEERMSERELKKPILREAAKLLGVPELVLKRRKHAMQYASGVHRIIMRNADSLNEKFSQNFSALEIR